MNLLSPAQHIFLADTVRLDPWTRPVEALAVANGKVVATGMRDDARTWGKQAEVHDFGNATITPGLIDAHSHAVSAGVNRRGAELVRCGSLTEVVRTLLDQKADESCEWLLGWSLDPNLFQGKPPTNAFLTACADRPVFVSMADGHSAVVNPAALHRAGVTGRERFDSVSSVVCDEKGEPTGLLLEDEALTLIRSVIPLLNEKERATSLLQLLTGMAQSGLTTLSLLDLNESTLPTLAQMELKSTLPIRLRCSPVFEPGPNPVEELAHVLELQRHHGKRWLVEGVKFVLDGTIENGTAWLSTPDSVGESRESLWFEPSNYRTAVRALAERSIATATHAIGDAAIRYAVSTIAELSTEQRTRAPHRIEHVEVMPDDLLQAFILSGAIASMQPTHSTLYVWPDHKDEWSRRLGTERAKLDGFRFRDLVDTGVTVALGSDWPVAPYDPRGIIADAQLRRPHGRADAGRTFPRQQLTAGMALDSYTLSAARAIGWQDRIGALSVGMNADLAIFELDPLGEDPEAFASSAVLGTAIDGQLV